jgi:cytochrome c
MLDTMTLTKVTGAFCGTFLIFLLGKFAAEQIYHMGGESHDGEIHQAYTIDTGDDGETDVVVDEGPDLATLMASADLGKGERVFGKCKACHKLEDGAKGTGPHLYNVVDRAIGQVDGFGYSSVLAENGDAWTPEHLDAFLENPKGWAPGTKMSFAGLKKPEDRANVIAYLQGIGG